MDGTGQGCPSPTKRRRPSENERLKGELRDILHSLANEYGLHFPSLDAAGGLSRLPSTPHTPDEKAEKLIVILFYHDLQSLRVSLSKFKVKELELEVRNPLAAASFLHRLLKDQWESSPNCQASMFRSFSGPADEGMVNLKPQNGNGSRSASTSFNSNSFNDSGSSRLFTSESTSAFTTSAATSLSEPSVALEDPFQSNLEHYCVRDLPRKGFFSKRLPTLLYPASEPIRYECVRIAQLCSLDLECIANLYTDEWGNYDILYKTISTLVPTKVKIPRVSGSIWNAAASRSPNLDRTGRFEFRKESDGELFNFALQPLQESAKGKTCRLFRHFGAHRFLTVDIPLLRNAPSHLKAQEANIRRRLKEWCCAAPTKELAGYEWKVLYIKPGKDKKAPTEYTITFFAERGVSLQTISVEEVVRWFMPLEINTDLSLHKAFARIALGLSKTYTTMVFKPSQIRYVDDIFADGTIGDVTMIDPIALDDSLSWSGKYDPQNPLVMDDGCSRISLAAAKQIWAGVRQQPGPCPSVFQARIGPWKGLWMINATTGQKAKDEEIWIEVTPSQRKFMPHVEDRDDNTFQADRLTFEVLAWSCKVTESLIYKDFLPILEDRGVPRKALATIVNQMLDGKRVDFFTALASTTELFKWTQSFAPAVSDVNAEWSRFCVADRVKMLLAAGFDVQSEYLVKQVKMLAGSYFKRITAELVIPLRQSAYVFGVADPVRCLGPDEIHLAFSNQFGDEPFPFLDNVDALVARHPALRRSDMQKVRVVYKKELWHLLDVVVFPTRGCIPLASKLQGGDYDGDRFWICWERSIVEPFRNIPAPDSLSLKPEDFGIEVDKRKLAHICVEGDVVVNDFRAAGVTATLLKQHLGVVTIFLRNLCYGQNSIATKEAETVVNLHDFLVDSSKNGYSFSPTAWRQFKQSLRGIDYKKVENQIPAFITATKSTLFDSRMHPPSYNAANIVDHLTFIVAWVHTLKTLSNIESFVTVGQSRQDASLSKLFSEVYSEDSMSGDILRALRPQLIEICAIWEQKRNCLRDDYKITAENRDAGFVKSAEAACRAYELLTPTENALPRHSTMVSLWLHQSIPNRPSHWELVKASTIFTVCPKYQDFVFACAGKDLCYIKAHSTCRPIVVTPSIFSGFKMKTAKFPAIDGMRQNILDGGDGSLVDAPLDCDYDDDPFVHALADYDYEIDTEEDEPENLEVYYEAMESMSQKLERSSLKSPKKRRQR